MRQYLTVRLARAGIVLTGLIVVTFVLTRTVGDPVQVMLPLDASQAEYERLRALLGFDRPLVWQFVAYIRDVLTGDFGTSLWQGTDALPLVLGRLPATFLLATSAIGLGFVVGLPLGILGGLRPGSLFDRATLTLSGLAVSIPDFWLGIMLVLLFAVQLDWLPTGGYGTWQAAILPVVTLAFRPLGRVARIARDAVIDELDKKYVVAAQAKGLTLTGAVRRHVVKNILITAMTILGYEYIFVFTGYAVGVETVFSWPGIGKLAVDAVLNQDVILVSTIVIVTGLLVVVVNTGLDLLHAAVDRRVQL